MESSLGVALRSRLRTPGQRAQEKLLTRASPAAARDLSILGQGQRQLRAAASLSHNQAVGAMGVRAGDMELLPGFLEPGGCERLPDVSPEPFTLLNFGCMFVIIVPWFFPEEKESF